ncbi:PBP1A family penicillin-binding protein, partial [Candidatus Azambacteria bacterium]|nr:PBP1A family penicillin-binding protein [Candidatus Azambacteria bacterium]
MVKLLFKKIKTIIKVIFCLALLGAMFLVAGFFYFAKDLPDLNKLTQPEVVESTKIYDRTGATLLYDVYSDVKRTSLKSEEIPQKMIDATISIEDRNFLKHGGLSFRSIFRAIGANLFSGKVVQGGSTITQQLIKNSFLTPERTIVRKIKEVILAYQMERQYSKKEIITSYLNTISYGSGAYGIEAASQTFFGKSVKQASLAEMALLAALPKAPSYYSPYGSHLDQLIQRRNSVIDKTAEANLVTLEEALFAKKETPRFIKSRSSIRAPHFVMYIKEYLSNKYGEEFIDKAGLKVITTLDYDLQGIAEEIIKKAGEVNEKKFQAKNAGLVAIDPKTGQVLVMVGSRDYFDVKREGNFNITTAQRQPGSSFKPIVYALALKKGYTPETVLFDLPTEFNPLCTLEKGSNSLIIDSDKCYHPENFDSKYRGPVMLKEAISQSINVASVKLLYLVGVNNAIDFAETLGLTTLKDRSRFGLSLVLGGGEVKLLEMVNAYGVFANDGVKNDLTSILRIEDKNGKIIEEYQPRPQQVLESQYARLLNKILSDNELRVPVFGRTSALYLPDYNVAVKTGTTNAYHDLWTIGYAPNLAAGVWVGNNDNTPMVNRAFSASVAAPWWQEFMKQALARLPKEKFVDPAPVSSDKTMLNGKYIAEKVYKIDKVSKKLATDLT